MAMEKKCYWAASNHIDISNSDENFIKTMEYTFNTLPITVDKGDKDTLTAMANVFSVYCVDAQNACYNPFYVIASAIDEVGVLTIYRK